MAKGSLHQRRCKGGVVWEAHETTAGDCISEEPEMLDLYARKRAINVRDPCSRRRQGHGEASPVPVSGGPVACRMVIDGAMTRQDGDGHHRHMRAVRRHAAGVGGGTRRFPDSADTPHQPERTRLEMHDDGISSEIREMRCFGGIPLFVLRPQELGLQQHLFGGFSFWWPSPSTPKKIRGAE